MGAVRFENDEPGGVRPDEAQSREPDREIEVVGEVEVEKKKNGEDSEKRIEPLLLPFPIHGQFCRRTLDTNAPSGIKAPTSTPACDCGLFLSFSFFPLFLLLLLFFKLITF